MTKRFSVDDVALMLQTNHELVRKALERLIDEKRLSAETFLFASTSWRIAPNDVTMIQDTIKMIKPSGTDCSDIQQSASRRRIVRKNVDPT